MADIGIWITALASLAVAIVAGVFAVLNRRGGEKARQTPSWVELDQANRDLRDELDAMRKEFTLLRLEMDDLKRDQVNRSVAITNVLHDIASQWPREAPPPKLNSHDLEVLGDTMPRRWRFATS